MGRAWVIAKKVFSISLVFNALLTIACCLSILGGFYWFNLGWKPFAPYLIDGAVFWFAIAAAAINIYPSAMLGRKLHTGRFLFHHYFYGLVVIICATLYIFFFTSQSLFTIFFVNNTSVEVNIGRFFFLGGLALLLDDLPDVSERIEGHLNWLKDKARQVPLFMGVLQAVTGAVSLYIAIAILWGMISVPEWFTAANLIVLGSTLVTGVASFVFLKRGFWHNMEPNHPKEAHKH
jgi:hypothetical protein